MDNVVVYLVGWFGEKNGIKYLGVFLGTDAFLERTWDGLADRVKGRLEKWKWILPQLSYRGRNLIIYHLVASSLWHRLACV